MQCQNGYAIGIDVKQQCDAISNHSNLPKTFWSVLFASTAKRRYRKVLAICQNFLNKSICSTFTKTP